MTSNLILPAHVADAVEAQRAKEALDKIKANSKKKPEPEVETEDEGDPIDITAAYVKEEERVMDPTKLPESALARMPQPTGWRILILPYRGSGKTKGGILMADETIERNSVATVVGYVLAVGPEAYADKTKFPTGPWCKKGDWVMIGRYAGARFRIEGGEVRIINDDEVIATIVDPADVLSV
jgi:co-chaperonin GroES (HSP10)